ncbi:hypothetical protein ABZS61_33475 [Streptomyces sp. NPDC005566]|uniref:hypothetical protein n=1 Tax=Streptomyces sp. NPDC005566 TaxID=3156886 RepID=UPI0033A9E93D
MSVQTVRLRTDPEQVTAVSEQLKRLFAALRDSAPQRISYLAIRDAEEPVFTLILKLSDGAENPLPLLPAAAAFRSWLPGQTDDDPTPRLCTVIDRYSA